MEYLKINGVDFSNICKELNVNREVNYNSQTNAAGNSVVEYINAKRVIEIGIIPISDATMLTLLAEIEKFNIQLSFRNPRTNTLETINCIVPTNGIEYFTIQSNKVMYNEMTFECIEL